MPLPKMTAPIGRVPTRELTIERIRDWILEGTLEPGETIRAEDIAESLGISRTPVREALLKLEQEGLIETAPNRWTRIAPIDLDQAVSLYEMIIELEVFSTRLAASRIDGHLTDLEIAQQAFSGAVERTIEDPRQEHVNAVRQADDAFHGVILAAAANPFLSDTLLPLKLRAQRLERFYFAQTPTIGRASITDHELIIGALSDRDAEAAATIARRNWERTLIVIAQIQANRGK